MIRPSVIPVTPRLRATSYEEPFNAEDAKSNAELAEKRSLETSAWFSASSALKGCGRTAAARSNINGSEN